MIGPVLLIVCLLLIGLSFWQLQHGLRKAQTDRVLERLGQGQPEAQDVNTTWTGLERMFQRAGLGKPTDRLGLWVSAWVIGALLGWLLADGLGLIAMIVGPPPVPAGVHQLALSTPRATHGRATAAVA